MEYIKRNSDYALRGLTYMARYPLGRIFTVDEIAYRQKMPKFFLTKIFRKLSKQKIIKSKRGIGGGFCLLKSPQKINILKILESVQGPVSLNKCLININTCNISKNCKIRKKLGVIQENLTQLLRQTMLIDMA